MKAGNPKKGASELISADALSRGHALSLTNQPYLNRLLKIIRDPSAEITLVLGAGVSIDSGLPNWTRLLDFMSEQIPDKAMRSLVSEDSSADPTRRAEYIQRLVAKQTNRSTHEMVRDALYQDHKDPEPGALANALARFVGTAPQRFTVLTTNFDRIFESALEDNSAIQTKSLGLEDAEQENLEEQEDAGLDCEDEPFKVTHLHGMVLRNDGQDLSPLILTEAEFLREGPRVRKIIADRLRSSTVVFVGLSLTDPNLVNPLWDLAHNGVDVVPKAAREHFVLTVVPDIGVGTFDDVCEYELEKAAYLDENFSLRPVFMKSYSQLIQLANDMGLASAVPARYQERPHRGSSIRYGARLRTALSAAYSRIGCKPRQSAPIGTAGEELSERLYLALTARGGPIPALEMLHAQLVARNPSVPSVKNEHFGLGLWLRVPGRRGHTRAPYAIQLMGSSVGSHRDGWSFYRREEITRRSQFIAAKCLYQGRTEVGGVKPTDMSSVWKGILATPLTIYGSGSAASVSDSVGAMLDRVTVGVATLNTTGSMDTHAPDRSLISFAHESGELAAIAKAVGDVVTALIIPATELDEG